MNFFSSDVLFINFPPERRDDIETYHEKQIRNLIGAIPNPRAKWLSSPVQRPFIQNTNGVVREEDSLCPDKPSGKALLHVERFLNEATGIDTTVIRFSGLIGYDRAPIKSIRRKKLVLNPDCLLTSYTAMTA